MATVKVQIICEDVKDEDEDEVKIILKYFNDLALNCISNRFTVNNFYVDDIE